MYLPSCWVDFARCDTRSVACCFIWYLCLVWRLAGPCLGHRVTSSAARRRGQVLRCCASAPSSQCMGCCGPRRGATSTSNTLSLHSHPHAHPHAHLHFYQHSHSHLRRQQSERSDPCRWRQPRRSVAQVSHAQSTRRVGGSSTASARLPYARTAVCPQQRKIVLLGTMLWSLSSISLRTRTSFRVGNNTQSYQLTQPLFPRPNKQSNNFKYVCRI